MVDYIFDAAKSLPWMTPFKAIKMIVADGWLADTIEEFIQISSENQYTAAMEGDVRSTANAIVNNMSVFPIAILVGMLVAYLFSASFLRKKNCPRSLFRTILSVLLDLLFTTILLAGVVALLGVWSPSVFITSIITAILYGFISITEAYFAQRDEGMKYKDIVNPKSIGSLLLSYLILILIAIFIIALFFLLPWKIISVVLALPVIIITFINYNLAAESYVASKRKTPYQKMKKKKKKKRGEALATNE
jgi:magnesium-transporting ATPase (P-type)